MGDWAQLPLDILHQITGIFSLPDLIRFGCVCSPWRSVATPARHKGRLPFLVVPTENNSQETGNSWPASLSFFSPLDKNFYKIDLPQLKGRRICGSSNGWLITVHKNADIHLIHPLSNKIIDLPSLNDIPGVYGMHFSQENGLQYIVSDSPEPTRGDAAYENAINIRDSYVLKLIVAPSLLVVGLVGKHKRLFFRKPEMEEWKMVIHDPYIAYHDVTFYKQRFYAIDSLENLYVLDWIGTSMPYARPIVPQPASSFHMYYNGSFGLYLVECSGDLFKVVRSVIISVSSLGVVDGEKTVEFKVFKFVFEKAEWLEVKDLGGYALFLGTNQSSSVCVSEFPGCIPNCIYFMDDSTRKGIGSCDNGVYNLEDKTINSIFPNADGMQVILPRPVWYASMEHC